MGGGFRFSFLGQVFDDFIGALLAHVEDLDAVVVRKGSFGLVKEPLYGTRIAGGNLYVLALGDELLDAVVAACRHLAEVGDAFEGFSGFTESLKDFVFGAFGNDLGKGASAIEDLGGRLAQGEGSWDWSRSFVSGSAAFNGIL